MTATKTKQTVIQTDKGKVRGSQLRHTLGMSRYSLRGAPSG